VPTLTELEWPIKPLLDEWAEVASYDAPGVGDEPALGGTRIEANADRGLAELDRRGWDRCVVVGDELSSIVALLIARTRPDTVAGLVLGHACLEYRLTGAKPTLHPEIASLGRQLMDVDFRAFVHQALGAWDQDKVGLVDAPVGETLVEAYLERVPAEAAAALYGELLAAVEAAGAVSIEHAIRAVSVPLMFVKHEGCVFFTPESFDEAVAAFPNAAAVAAPESPGMSPKFAEALREFCESVAG